MVCWLVGWLVVGWKKCVIGIQVPDCVLYLSICLPVSLSLYFCDQRGEREWTEHYCFLFSFLLFHLSFTFICFLIIASFRKFAPGVSDVGVNVGVWWKCCLSGSAWQMSDCYCMITVLVHDVSARLCRLISNVSFLNKTAWWRTPTLMNSDLQCMVCQYLQ